MTATSLVAPGAGLELELEQGLMTPALPPRPVGLIAAVDSEGAILRRMMRSWAGLAPYVEISGMGQRAAEKAAERLVARGVSGLMSFGYAGALKPGIRRGAVVVAEAIETPEGGRHETDSYWRAGLAEALSELSDVRFGSFLSVREVVASPGHKRRLASRSDAMAVDMESGAIASVARRHGLPFIAVRAIVDEAHHSVPAALSGAIDKRGRTQAWRMAWPLIKRPGQIAALLSLAKGADAANRALLDVCRLAGPGFRLV